MKEITKMATFLVVGFLVLACILSGSIYFGFLRGKKGDTGAIGPMGPQGNPGKDELNHFPSIVDVSQSGSYVAELRSFKYVYHISTKMTDLDNDNLKMSIYTSSSYMGPWTLNDVYYGDPYDEIEYDSTIVYTYYDVLSSKNTEIKTSYWLIEIWDGSDITTEKFSYTIDPSIQ